MTLASRTVRRAAVATMAAFAVTLSACSSLTGGSGGQGAGDGELTLGLLAPLTGAAAADGKAMQNGAELAVDQLNAAGGVKGRKLTLQAIDVKDQTSAAVSSAVTTLTADPNVVAAFTGYASTTNFEIDSFAQAGIPYVLGGNSAQTQEIVAKAPDRYPGIWSIAPSYDGYSTNLPNQLEQWNTDGTFPLRNRKAYLISSDNAYSNQIAGGLKTNLTAKGWQVTGPDTVPFGAVDDWTTQINKIHALDPALVLNLDYQTANAAKFLTQFRQNPTQSLVFEQYAPSVPEFVTLAGASADGVLFNLPIAPVTKTQVTQDMIAKYTQKYGSAPANYAFIVYEAVRMWAQAADKVGDPAQKDKVGPAIGTLDDQGTTLGRIRFDPATHLAVSGDDGVPFINYQIQGGKRVAITPANYAEGSFQKPAWIR
ncbi:MULTISPECIES: ABC transporter substrate-binding protein [Amycolatopsis]|uniref:Branched-chain amino acid transport system substrate-binding protein n=2 Tax=Amycolatopsis TaxID=1813 RepID=A0A1I4BP34_9PSEU|nr:ABC transporter substrate-binding protein [Amycolatopsis sacchari]SFK69621.1 branched-chain amino acid transport system substrate-binding protein [Amycolatopsis sacchari]